ncbi:MAG: CpsD/CapB family tyrosine-protein kinase [Desulfobacterales bacterium]
MKLQKAIDKARMKQTASMPTEPVQAVKPSPVVKPEDNGQLPVYTDSAAVTLDEALLKENRCVCFSPDAPELDLYKVLRTQILHRSKKKGWNTIMVTSTRPGEGKTLTSINLALTFAKAHGQTVLLVDCDLRQQKVHTYLGLDSHSGIADYLLKGRPLEDLILWPKVEKMTLISGGQTIIESAELLGSQRMKELVAEMKSRYGDRYVIFDTPPLLSGADALIFSQLVDGIVMVVEEGRTPIKEVEKALNLIPKEKFLGFVLNKARITQKGYYGYYRQDVK